MSWEHTVQVKQVAVLGGGSFGTVIANILADAGIDTYLWMRRQEAVDEILTTHENSYYLPNIKLNKNIKPTTNLHEAIIHSDIIFISIPSKHFLGVVREIKDYVNRDQMLVSCTKGIEAEGFRLMSQILRDETGLAKVGVLSGPNLAKEIAERKLTGTVIASDNMLVRNTVQEALSCSYFRVYVNSDMYGVELGGALKNIYAIASGMASALGMGENTKSMLITRSIAEMSRFAHYMGANPLTFLGLAGVGDLFVTCSSPLSRNFQLGQMLADGLTLIEATKKLKQTAEGINTVRLVKHKADELGIYMPIVSGLFKLMFEDKKVNEIVQDLMLGEKNSDVEFVLPRKTD